MGEPLVLLLALGLDAWIGDPDWLWQRIPHPIVAFGRAIGFADRTFNCEDDNPHRRRTKGMLATVALIVLSMLIGLALAAVLQTLGTVGAALEIGVIFVLLAQRSLAEHVRRVTDGLRRGGLADGRFAVSMIVGRDPQTLDEAGVCQAAIESLAENFSDGVVAPAFWYLIGGLPGIFAYKLINTADSMIGHRTPRHEHFGRFAARVDDVANIVPARISALLIALVSGRFGAVFATVRSDASRHRSPNAGWPETAMAGALGIALGGPRSYGAELLSEPVLNAGGRRAVGSKDITRALTLFWRACAIYAAVIAILAASRFA